MILACECGKKFKIPPEKAATLKPGSFFKCTGCGKQIPIPASDPAMTPHDELPAVHHEEPPAPPTEAADPALPGKVAELQELLDTERKIFSEELDQLKEENAILKAQIEEQEKLHADSGKADDRLDLMQKERAALAEEVLGLKARAEESEKERAAISKDLHDAEAAIEEARKGAGGAPGPSPELERERDEARQRAAEVEKERDEARQRVLELEKERDEARQRVASLDEEVARRVPKEEAARVAGDAASRMEEFARRAADLATRVDELAEPIDALRKDLEKAIADARNGGPVSALAEPAPAEPAPTAT